MGIKKWAKRAVRMFSRSIRGAGESRRKERRERRRGKMGIDRTMYEIRRKVESGEIKLQVPMRKIRARILEAVRKRGLTAERENPKRKIIVPGDELWKE